jgi:hypothetical protein
VNAKTNISISTMSFSGKPRNLTTSIPAGAHGTAPEGAAPGKRGKAAWSRVEDVLAERQLEKELRDIFEDD